MKNIKYGVKFFRKHAFAYLLMILQLAFLIIAENTLIANRNSRDILYSPYEDILQKDGFYYFQCDRSGILDDEGYQIKSSDERLAEIVSSLKGSNKLYCMYYADIPLESGESIRVNILEDEIYNDLRLPLESGKIQKGKCIITSNDLGLNVGDTIEPAGKSVEISGVLTYNTYIPRYNQMSESMSADDLYKTYSSTVKSYSDGVNFAAEAVAPKSLFQEKIDASDVNIYRTDYLLITFDEKMSAEDMQYNKKVLEESNQNEAESGWAVSLSQINEKSRAILSEDFDKMLPIVVCIIAVILIGVVCSSAIITAKQLRRFAVLYITGASPLDCVKISCVTAFISSAIAAAAALALMKLGIADSFANETGFTWGMNNTAATICTVVFAIAAFAVIPAIVISRKKFDRD